MISSLWDDTLLEADVAVIGAGLIGTSTALELAEAFPEMRIVLLERDIVPFGASSRNAGFACFGSLSEVVSDVNRIGLDAALAVLEWRRSGLERLRARLGDAALGFEAAGGYEVFVDDHPALTQLDDINTVLGPLFEGGPVYHRCDDMAEAFGFGPQVRAMVHTPYEGVIQSGTMMQELWRVAARHGIGLRTGCTVLDMQEGHDGVHLHVSASGTERQMRVQRVVVATNAFISQLLPWMTVVPGRGQIILTSPVASLPLRGSFHMDEGFVYFRNVGQRILLGGGRNRDIEGETTTAMETTDTITDYLEDILRTVILPAQQVAIDRRWAGIMGFSASKQPIVERRNRTIGAFGCNGMGVAIGSHIARMAASECLAEW